MSLLRELARSVTLLEILRSITETYHCVSVIMQVPGAEVKVYRISDPVRGDNPEHFEEGVLDAPLVTDKVSQCLALACIHLSHVWSHAMYDTPVRLMQWLVQLPPRS